MSDDPYKRGRALLAKALKECEIPERAGEDTEPRFGGQNVCWEVVGNDVRIVFSYYHAGAGSVHCSISLGHLAIQTAQGFPKYREAVDALNDALRYLESSVSVLLPTTHLKLLRRVFNLKVWTQFDKNIRKDWLAALDQLSQPSADRREQAEKKFSAERDWRGGSTPRLEKEKRKSLHVEYDAIYQAAKPIKKDYDATFSRFEEARRRSGYNPKQWQEFWVKYASEMYQHDPAFLFLFANQDNPSASEIAYRQLALDTGHTRSYIESLVLDSRKKAGKSKRSKKPTKKRIVKQRH
jgi:hypothetical protein